MSMIGKTHNPLNNNKGITIVLVAILLFVLVGFVGLALDVSYMYVVKGQLQNAADAGALAGAAKLNNAYGTSPCDPSLYLSSVKAEAKRIAEKNNAAGSSLTDAVELDEGVNELTDDNDVTIGHWYAETTTYIPGDPNPNAVLVRVRRTTESPLGQVRLFISRLLGWQTMATAAEAVAVSEPAPFAPIVVNEYWLHLKASKNDNVPYNVAVHTYPNSFVRETPVHPLPEGTEKAYGKIFAIMGNEADPNVPASEGKGSQAINGYANLNYRSSRHDGAADSWHRLDQKKVAAAGCISPTDTFPSVSPISQGMIDSTKFDESLGYLFDGYNYVPPTAVQEKYSPTYIETYYNTPTSDNPYATVAPFSTSGKSGPLNKEYNDKYFADVHPPGDKIVAMVYDGTFKPNTDQQMPTAVTVVGYVLVQIDGYADTNPGNPGIGLTLDDKRTIRKDFLKDKGSTVYAHAVAPMIEPTGTFDDLYVEINRLRWRGGKVRLVIDMKNRGLF